MSATTRELAITYGSYATGAAATRPIHGFRVETYERDRASVTWDFLIVADSEAALGTAVTDAQTAFKLPYQNLTVVQGSTTLVSASQSGNTGLDPMPTLTKIGSAYDTGRSQMYRASVSWGLPASWGIVSGLRNYAIEFSETGSERATIVLSGTFTAVGANDAKATYDAGIGTLVTAAMTYWGVSTYERSQLPRLNVSVNKKTLDFTVVYRQLITTQANATKVRNQQLVVTRTRQSVENSPLGADGGTSSGTVLPLCDVQGVWTCDVDRTETTDLVGLWESSIREYAINQVREASGAVQFGLTSDSPSFNKDENKISATIRGVCPDPDGSGCISYRWEQTYRDQGPAAFLPAWTGDPQSAFVYSPILVRTRETRTTKKTVSTDAAAAPSGASGGGGGAAVPAGVGGGLNFGLGGFGLGTPTFGAGLYGAYDPPGATGSFYDVDLTQYANAQREGRGEAPLGSGGAGGGGGGAPAGGGGVGNGGGGGAGGQAPSAPKWFLLDYGQTVRPWTIGRPPFTISGTETTTIKLEREVKPIRGRSGGS